MKWQDGCTLAGGYFPNQAPLDMVPNTILDGAELIVVGAGRVVTWNACQSAAGTGNAVMTVVQDPTSGADVIATAPNGSIFTGRNRSIWWVSAGAVTVNGVRIDTAGGGTPTASSLNVYYNGGAYAAGLQAPSAPAVCGLDGTSTLPAGLGGGVAPDTPGKNLGSYSYKIARVRSTTGAYSNASPASAVVAVKKKKIRVQLASALNGSDRTAVFASYKGFGASGPWKLLGEYKISDYPSGYVDVDHYDGDLDFLFDAPFDFDPPPDCTHAFGIAAVNGCAGALGGNMVSISLPGKLEAFPADLYFSLNPGHKVVGCDGRATDSYIYLWTANSLHALIPTSSSDVPIIERPLWSEMGIPSPAGACAVGNRLYCFVGERTAARTSDSNVPDTDFAKPVETYFASWTAANVVVGFSETDNAVVFAHGNKALMYSLGLGVWSTPLTLPGTVTGKVLLNGVLHLNVAGALYKFNKGSGPGAWYAVPAFRQGQYPGLPKSLYYLKVIGDGTMSSIDIYGDLDTTTLDTLSSADTGGAFGYHGDWLGTNIKDLESYSCKISGTGAARIDQILYRGSVKQNSKT